MTWKFDNPLGKIVCGALAAEVDAAHPERGLHSLRVDSSPIAGRICSVERLGDAQTARDATAWPANLVDAYVRGDDLVATYQGGDAWPFAPQIYWRAEAPEAGSDSLAAVTLLVSVSTHLLDTHPRLTAVSQLAADEMLQIAPIDDGEARPVPIENRRETVLQADAGTCCLLWRLTGGLLSYAEIAPATDFCKVNVRRDVNGAYQARWELIAEFLEKGVIRRTRLQAVFLPRERDIALASECCRRLVNRPLPLTT